MPESKSPEVEKIQRAALTTYEAAEALRVSRQHIYRLIERGELRKVKIGRFTRIPTEDVYRLLGVEEG